MFDLSMMKSFVEQVWYKKRIQMLKKRNGLKLAGNKTDKEIFLEGL